MNSPAAAACFTLGPRELEQAAGAPLTRLPADPGAPILLELSGFEGLSPAQSAQLLLVLRALENEGRDVALRVEDAALRRQVAALRLVAPPEPRHGELAGPSALEGAILFGHVLRCGLGDAIGQVLRLDLRRLRQSLGDTARMGIGAVPLVGALSFLLGAILALLSAPRLEQFGQEIFVADLVALSMCQEIAPLLTAILVCGRSGAALTAEVGTMKVTEEIDALEVMGLSPIALLVAPRMRALVVVLPLLTVAADLSGILGGFVVGTQVLEIAPVAWTARTLEATTASDFLRGLLKAGFFAIVIAAVCAWQGFSAPAGASGVGRATTRAVVYSIVGIVIVDFVVSLVLYATGGTP